MYRLSLLYKFLICSVLIAAAPGLLVSLNAQPAAFYTDLASGPNSGGENNAGAYVNIYGKSFGASQGSSQVTVGGGFVAAYPVWSDSKITVQLGSAATSGNIVVTTGAGASNPLPFTVRAGNIYFVSTNGNNANAGGLAAPWKTIPYAVQHIASGDVIYVRDGVVQSTEDDWSAALLFRNEWCGGSAPRALVAYPGAKVTVGSLTAPLGSIRTTDASATGGACAGNWTFAGLYMPSVDGFVIAGGSDWRIVGNEFTCPNGDGASACVETSQAGNVKFYGNNTHDTGKAGASALYQGVYFSTDSNHLDIGWNTIANVRGCRGLQIHSSPLGAGGAADSTGHNQFDISIHDNNIHDTQCDGIVIATVDPSAGQVSVYRNLIYRAGKGPNNPETSGSWTCLNVQGHTNNGAAGGGTVEVYSNTFYDCGSFANPPYGGANGGVMNGGENPNLLVRVRNNIFYQNNAAAPYLAMYVPGASSTCTDADNCTAIGGSNNLFFGIGPGPVTSALSASVNQNPLFVNAAGGDFHLSAGSPAADTGTAIPQGWDFDGLSIPRGSGYPIGAFELGAAGSGGVQVSVGPSSATLSGGQTQTFAATVSGTTNTSANWSVSPAVGSVSSVGVYTAPATISGSQTVVVTATSVADGTKAASATVNLTPVAVGGLSPVSLSAAQTQQFTATVSGVTNTAVNWNLSAAIGTITGSGLYTAPAAISSQQTVTVSATSVADGTKSASAVITLLPAISVGVSPGTVTLGAGGTQQFGATVTGTGTTSVTWSRSPAVGMLSSSGLYTAPLSLSSQQIITIKATSSVDATKFATVSVTLTPSTGVSVTMTPGSVTLGASGTQQFSASVTGVSNTAIVWTQSAAIGTLSTSGMYTAPASIPTTYYVKITATSVADGSKFATALITLPQGSVSVGISPAAVTLGGGGTQQFGATIAGAASAAVTWSMSPAVGTLSASGFYSAPSSVTSAQTVLVKATSTADNTKFATATVTLTPSAGVSVTMTPGSVALGAGSTQQFSAAVTGTSNTAIVWTQSAAIGTLSTSGMYTAPASIPTTYYVKITATSVADSSKFATALITLPQVSVSVGISPAAVTMGGGGTQQFGATISGAASAAVTWSMSPAVGTLSASGFYSAPSTVISAQTVLVTATSTTDSTKSATAVVTLTPAVSVTMTPGSVTLGASGTQQFSAAVTGTSNTAIVWTQSAPIGTLSTSGMYTAPASITTTYYVKITATSVADSSKFATALVTLPQGSVSVGISPAAVTLGGGGTQQFGATISGAASAAVTWSMSPAVGSLSASGLYTAPASVTAPYTIQLTATSAADSSKFATAIINLAPPVSVSVTPAIVSLSAGNTQQLSATVTGASNTAVSWSLSPAAGTISPTGFYTAPTSIIAKQAVTIRATSSADSSKFATATIGLLPSSVVAAGGGAPPPPSTPTVSYTILSRTSAQVTWTAPADRPSNDWIGLTATNAQGWWYVTSWSTNGAPSGSFTVNVPTSAGQYEFRYFDGGTFNILSHSAAIAVGSGFSVVPTQTVSASGSNLSVKWTAGSGRLAGDILCLFPIGSDNGGYLTCSGSKGVASGTASFESPTSPGLYEVRYITRGYVNIVSSAPITVNSSGTLTIEDPSL